MWAHYVISTKQNGYAKSADFIRGGMIGSRAQFN